MENKKEIIFINESILRSVVKDTYTFGLILGSLIFNHKLLGGSSLIDLVFIAMAFFMILSNKSSVVHKFKSKQEAMEYLRNL